MQQASPSLEHSSDIALLAFDGVVTAIQSSIGEVQEVSPKLLWLCGNARIPTWHSLILARSLQASRLKILHVMAYLNIESITTNRSMDLLT